jgi:microcystin-dependent protein
VGIRSYNNTSQPQTILNSGGIDNNPLTVGITVGDNRSYPPVPFTMGIERGTPDQEVVECTALTGCTGFIVTRGFNGSPVVAHPQGASVELTSAAIDFAEANLFINIMTTKGDIITFGADAQRHGVGADGTVLTADQTQPDGLSWVQPVPSGVVFYTAASAAPAGFVLANGQSLARSGNGANLFAQIGTTYGSVDGAHFNVPNVATRTIRGNGSGYPLAATGGADTAAAQLPAHTHGYTIAIGGTSVLAPDFTQIIVKEPGSTIQLVSGASSTSFGASFTETPSVAINIESAGNSNSINIVNKYIVLTPIIKL